MAIRYRDAEGCEPEALLMWDTVWIQRIDAAGGFGDWRMAGPGDQIESRGGLRAEAALHTATLLQLFSDRRADPADILPNDAGDRRGWWGDSVRLEGEPDQPLGSRLWLLERARLNEATRQAAEDYAIEALEVLREQGAVSSTDVVATIDRTRAAIIIDVTHYGVDGSRIYLQRFGVVWQQAALGANMNFGQQGLVA